MLVMKNISVRNTLKNLNLSVNRGDFVLIVGENGSGKTTLFSTISGQIKPSCGQIFIGGNDVTEKNQLDRSSVVANVFQDPKVGTIGKMSIRDNLNMAYMRGKFRTLKASCTKERDDFFREKLSVLKMGLENRLDTLAEELSGGQRQVISVLMTLLSPSNLLLLDEITAALDSKSSENILNIVSDSICRQKKTCLMITHDKSHINKIENRVLVLKNGQL